MFYTRVRRNRAIHYRGILMSFAAFLLIVGFLGCNSGDNGSHSMMLSQVTEESRETTDGLGDQNGSSPTPLVLELPNEYTATITDAYIADSVLVVEYEQVNPEGQGANRTLQLGLDGHSAMICDTHDNVLTGVAYRELQIDRLELAIVSGEQQFTISGPKEGVGQFVFSRTSASEQDQVAFADEAELELAATIYDSVHNLGVDPLSLNLYEQALLERAEQLHDWGNLLTSSAGPLEIEAAVELQSSREFRDWLLEDPELPQPVSMSIPKFICRVVWIAQRACERGVFGDGQFCEWVYVLNMICTLLEEAEIIR
ncbi:hypothetical protein GF420_06315 [candidate division GN15 bacterium]|nr:hypothetical protein [candidate division GN15 bacterium]